MKDYEVSLNDEEVVVSCLYCGAGFAIIRPQPLLAQLTQFDLGHGCSHIAAGLR